MPVNILMPALSPTMEKGNLAKWLKHEGDKVKAGDVIAEIETDKATMEYESIDDGVLAKIVVPEGTQDVAVNQLIAVLAQEGEDPKAAAAAAGKGPRRQLAAPAKRRDPPSRPRPSRRRYPRRINAPASAAPAPRRRTGSHPRLAAGRADGHGNRVFASPLARRLAKDAGIELGAHPGHRARMGASSRATSRRPNRAGALRPATVRAAAAAPADRAVDVGPARSARSTSTAATRSSRTTACAAPSRSG